MKDLSTMTTRELELYKTQMYNDNSKNGNISKLYAIARLLGEDVRHNYGPKYMLQDGFIQIYVDDYGGYMTVHEGLKLKVSTHNEKLYVPGEWEEIITRLYPIAKEKQEAQKAAKEQSEKSALLNQLK